MQGRSEKTEHAVTLRVFDAFSKIEPRWSELSGHEGNPTLSAPWLRALEETGCAREETGWIPYHLALFEGDALLAAAPCYLKLNSEGEFIFDWGLARAAKSFGVAYYPKLLVAVPFTPATGPRVLVAKGASPTLARAAFAAAVASLTDKLGLSSAHVLFSPEGEARALSEAGLLHRASVQFHFKNRGYATFEDFLKTLPSKRRTQLRREMRAPTEQGIHIETLRADGMSPALADTAFDLYKTTIDKMYWGRQYLNRSFFEAVMGSMKDRVELVAAKDDRGKIIAGAFNLRGDDTLYGRYWGTFVDVPFLHFNVCFYHSIERCIADGLSTFEPGAGGEHKLARGFDPTITHSVHFFADRRFGLAVQDLFAREREALEAEVASHRSDG